MLAHHETCACALEVFSCLYRSPEVVEQLNLDSLQDQLHAALSPYNLYME